MFKHVLCNQDLGRFRLFRLFAFLLLVETFVGAVGLTDASAPQLLEIVFGFLLRSSLYVLTLFLLAFDRATSGSALIKAFLIGSLVPQCLRALTIVWDYDALNYASVLLECLLVASRAIALNSSLVGGSSPIFAASASLLLSILVY